MSHKATAWAYQQQTGKPGAKFVLIALADFADEAHSCFPGQERLAAMTEQSVETVRRHLKLLEEARLIRRERRFTADGYRTSDRYVLNVDGQLDPGSEAPPVKSPTGQNDRRSNRRRLPVNLSDPTGQSEGVTVREPSDNPKGGQTALLDAGETKPRRNRRKPETPIPEDWKPSTRHSQYAAEHGLELATEVLKFRTHAQSVDRRLRDWDAGFTQWLIRAREYADRELRTRPEPRNPWASAKRVGGGWS